MLIYIFYSFTYLILCKNYSSNINGDILCLVFPFVIFVAFVVSGAGWNADLNVGSCLYVIIMSGTSFGVNPDSLTSLNVKKILAWSRRLIWSINDSNETRIHNHLVHKRTLNHLAKPAKWLSCVMSTYLYCTFDCHYHVTYEFPSESTL